MHRHLMLLSATIARDMNVCVFSLFHCLFFYAGSCKDIHDNNPSTASGEYFLITVTGRRLEKVRASNWIVQALNENKKKSWNAICNVADNGV